jgi:ParB/RepB/Spo0J family partition protein
LSATMTMGATTAPITSIKIREGFNAREIDPKSDEFQGLIESIKTMGVLVPLIVSPDPSDEDKYDLVAGHRRLLAASVAGLEEVPVVVRHPDSAEVDAAVENMGREQLWPLEEARAIAAVMDKGYTAEGAAQVLGVSQQLVTSRRRILDLPESVAKHWGPSPGGYPPMNTLDVMLRISEKSVQLAEAIADWATREQGRWGNVANDPYWCLQRLLDEERRTSPGALKAEISRMEGELKYFQSDEAKEEYEPDYLEEEAGEIKGAIADAKARLKKLGKKGGGLPWMASLNSFREHQIPKDRKDLRDLYESNKALARKADGYDSYHPRFGEPEADQARAAGVLLELKEDNISASVVLDEKLLPVLIESALKRDAEELAKKAEARAAERKSTKAKDPVAALPDDATPEQKEQAIKQSREKERERVFNATRRDWIKPESPLRAANQELFASLFKDLSKVKVDVDVARFFAGRLFGPEPSFTDKGAISHLGMGPSSAWEPVLDRVRICVPELSKVVTPVSEKTGKEGKPKVEYATHAETWKWVTKYLDGAKTPEEIFGRHLVLAGLGIESIAHAFAVSPANRPFAPRFSSRKDESMKALKRILKPRIPASVTKAKAMINRTYKTAGHGTGGDRI